MSNDGMSGLTLGAAIFGPDADRARARGDALQADIGTSVKFGLQNIVHDHEVQTLRAEKASWRNYAASMKANLDARKMSEHHLLEALKAENINHPLGKKEGFEAHFDHLLAEQYADIPALHENTDKDKAADEE